MNNLQFARLVALTMVLCLSAVSCKKSRVGVTPLESDPTAWVSAGVPQPGGEILENGPPYDTGQGTGVTDDGWELPPRRPSGDATEDRDTLFGYTIYFDFDQSVVRADEISKVQAVADYLEANPAEDLKIEGHCDERGTEEYNRALGERRALSPREALINMGIAVDRISTLSLGEDVPAVFGATEEAYAQNRRAEFVLLR